MTYGEALQVICQWYKHMLGYPRANKPADAVLTQAVSTLLLQNGVRLARTAK